MARIYFSKAEKIVLGGAFVLAAVSFPHIIPIVTEQKEHRLYDAYAHTWDNWAEVETDGGLREGFPSDRMKLMFQYDANPLLNPNLGSQLENAKDGDKFVEQEICMTSIGDLIDNLIEPDPSMCFGHHLVTRFSVVSKQP